MAPFALVKMVKMLFIFLLGLGQVVYSSPAELPRRGVCNQDNCLRELQHSSVLASPFCSTYLGAFTASTTLTITAYISTTTASAFEDRSITQLPKRSSVGVFYPSSCTEAPTAITSGCSCLLTDLPTITTTTTATAVETTTAALPTQCNAANNYGLITNGFGLEDSPGQSNHYYEYYEHIRGGCCARCFATPNCLAFDEVGDIGGGVIECLIWEVYEGPTTVQNPTCPFGSVTVSLTNPTSSGSSGVGPCGIAV